MIIDQAGSVASQSASSVSMSGSPLLLQVGLHGLNALNVTARKDSLFILSKKKASTGLVNVAVMCFILQDMDPIVLSVVSGTTITWQP